MRAKPARIAALDSLRGLLAVWVVGAHVASRSLLDSQVRSAHLASLIEPMLPVSVFIILSGFVVFYLLNREQLSYGAFLTRRLFRLVPLYFVVLLIAAPLVQTQLHVLESLPVRNHTILDSIRIHQETLAQFWPHLAAHVTLLHGLIPDAWLRDSSHTFLSPGWSISLEWQFYIVAPLLLVLMRQRRILVLVMLGAGCAALQFAQVAGFGFLPNQAAYFLLGISSWYLFLHAERLSAVKARVRDLVMVGLCVLTYLLLPNHWPVIIWLVVMNVVLAERLGLATWLTRLGHSILHLPAFKRLGEISYSIYLLHIPIMHASLYLIIHQAPGLSGWAFLAALLPLTLVLSIVASVFTHRFIELPAIRLGKRLSQPVEATQALNLSAGVWLTSH